MVTAAAAVVPETLVGQLAVGGIMVVPVGAPGGSQRLVRVRRDENSTETEELLDVRFVPLVNGLEIG